MAKEVIINKIEITPEAVFDYEDSLGLGWLDKRKLKTEVDEYIGLKNRSGHLLYENYFRCKYFDEDSGRMLMLFLYRAERLSVMQFWRLFGICFADDWDDDAENIGDIRHWLKNRITEPERGDWVIEQQVRAEADKIIIGHSVQGTINGLPREIKYAIEYGNDKEFTEALSVLQTSGGKRAWGRILAKKAAISRKLDKRTKRGGL